MGRPACFRAYPPTASPTARIFPALVEEQAGRPASLALDSAKRLRHAVLHSAGHAVDKAVVGAVGAGVFSPLKGYHFDDSPYVEYRGTLPAGLEKDAFIEKVHMLDK